LTNALALASGVAAVGSVAPNIGAAHRRRRRSARNRLKE
jgi:hypothetical protein